jgi:hypothetical protein
MELSPCRLTLCPLSAASTQFPPDCFRQPFREACWSPLVVLVVEVWLFWSVVDGLVVEGLVWLGCCWSGLLPVPLCEPVLPPVCANAMPEASISANMNFLFMSLLLRSFAPRGTRVSSPTSSEVRRR